MQRYPLKYLAPNAITCAGVTMGLVSVFLSTEGDYYGSAWFIVMCVLFDKADGSIARLLNASSEFGIQLDSFSDFITFGVAPGFLVHALLNDANLVTSLFTTDLFYLWGLRVSVVVYVLAACLRLAKFNVLTERIGQTYFLGVPTTLCGALLSTYILTSTKHAWPAVTLEVLPIVLLVMAYLMVSNFKMPKVSMPRPRFARYLMIGLIVGVYVTGLTWTLPEFLLGCGLVFLVFGFAYGAIKLPPVKEILGDDSPSSTQSDGTPG